MDSNLPPLEVGVCVNNGVETRVFLVYKDGQGAHTGTKRAYFYDAEGGQLRGRNFINNVEFFHKYRCNWQEFLKPDNRSFIENKRGGGETLRKSVMEKEYAEWVKAEAARKAEEAEAANLNSYGVTKPQKDVKHQSKRIGSNAKGISLIGRMAKDSLGSVSASNRRNIHRASKIIKQPMLPLPKPALGTTKRKLACADGITDPKKVKLDTDTPVDFDEKTRNFAADPGVSKEVSGCDFATDPNVGEVLPSVEHQISVEDEDPQVQNPVLVIADGKGSKMNSDARKRKKLVFETNRALLPSKNPGPSVVFGNFRFSTDHVSYWELPSTKLESEEIRERSQQAVAMVAMKAAGNLALGPEAK